MRDQNAASQQQLLIAAVKGYLASFEGQRFITAMGAGTNPANLYLSAAAAPGGCAVDPLMAGGPGALPTHAGLCNYLPTGFSSGTPNAYGQTYRIQVLKDGSPARTPANTYSFMIVTQNGDTIPDIARFEKGGSIPATNALQRIARATDYKLVNHFQKVAVTMFTGAKEETELTVPTGRNCGVCGKRMFWSAPRQRWFCTAWRCVCGDPVEREAKQKSLGSGKPRLPETIVRKMFPTDED
ncbi:MAG: hypothetical protein ACLQU2_03095 [Candidatus Binataceae bacterium]